MRNCLGDSDGTHVKIHVTQNDKVRCKIKKGESSTNMLGVCSKDLLFL